MRNAFKMHLFINLLVHKSCEYLESLSAEVLSKYVIWGSCSNEPCLFIRTCSSLGPVRRSRVSCMLKNQVEKPGRRFISSCGARDSTAPPRARPRSAGPAQSQTLVTVTTWPLVWVNRGSVCFRAGASSPAVCGWSGRSERLHRGEQP